jgi:GT2 family glycosyltransferase
MDKQTALILVNWNGFEYTNQCLISLNTCIQNFEIVVVDNGSTDESGKKLKAHHPHITLIQSESNLGFTGGNNLGITYAIDKSFEYIMLLNNDTFVEPNFLEVLVNYMNEHPEVGIVQPKIYCNHDRKLIWDGGSYFNSLFTLPYTSGALKKEQASHNKLKKVDWISGCAFFTRASILKESGLLNEKFFMYFEDVDLSFRIKKLGYQLMYHPKSVVYHIAGMSNKSLSKQKEGYVNPIVHYLIQRNRIWFLKKYTKPIFVVPTILYHTSYSIAMMIYFILRGRFKKLNALLRGIQDGIYDTI